MNAEAQEIAWQKFVEAEIVHKGHGSDGQGSPISQIVLEHYARTVQKMCDEKGITTPPDPASR